MNDWLEVVLGEAGEAPGDGTGPAAGRAALATIVTARGSTPRRPGARMVIYPDGRQWGSIGGGCGEAEVRRHALDVMDTGRPRLVTIELSGFFGDDEEVCGGRIEVFIEPLFIPRGGER